MSMRRLLLDRALSMSVLLAFVAPRASAQVLSGELHGSDSNSFGSALARIDDVDGDGIDDLLVTEHRSSAGTLNAGSVFVYSGATCTLIRAHHGGQSGEAFGWRTTGVGDFDGDGVGDYVIGASQYGTATRQHLGRIVAYSGRTGAPLWNRIGEEDGDYLGTCLVSIDDMDGDGVGELLTSFPYRNEVRILDETGTPIRILLGTAGSNFGLTAARVDDVDGDGTDDFLIGAPSWDSPSDDYVGEVRLYSGRMPGFLFAFTGDQAYDEFGLALSGLGDVTGDGVSDFLVGAPYHWSSTYSNDAGFARVVSGADGSTVRTHFGASLDEVDRAVARLGDLDGDGVDDYAVATAENITGLVHVHSGSDGSVIRDYDGSDGSTRGDNWFCGTALVAGDFNGDAIEDLAIGDSAFEEWTYGDEIGGVWIELSCPASWESYGAGWPGTNGIPALVALDDPGVAEPISLQLDNSLGAGTVALLFLGFTEASAPTSAGGTLLVVPSLSSIVALPAAGLVLSDTLPNNPALYFFDLFVQALEADPAASHGLSFTPGLVLHCGFDL